MRDPNRATEGAERHRSGNRMRLATRAANGPGGEKSASPSGPTHMEIHISVSPPLVIPQKRRFERQLHPFTGETVANLLESAKRRNPQF